MSGKPYSYEKIEDGRVVGAWRTVTLDERTGVPCVWFRHRLGSCWTHPRFQAMYGLHVFVMFDEDRGDEPSAFFDCDKEVRKTEEYGEPTPLTPLVPPAKIKPDANPYDFWPKDPEGRRVGAWLDVKPNRRGSGPPRYVKYYGVRWASRNLPILGKVFVVVTQFDEHDKPLRLCACPEATPSRARANDFGRLVEMERQPERTPHAKKPVF